MAIGGVIRSPMNMQMGGNASPIRRQPTLMDAAGASIGQTGSDYDSMMSQYRKLLDTGPTTTPLNYSPISANTSPYRQSQDVTSAMGNLADLSKTGGYSEGDLANIRERGVSPIRSIYANAQQNLNRQRALQGGYSPGYGAVNARMARDMSERLAGTTTDINARIAEMVARGRQQAAPQYAQFAGQQSGEENRANQVNAGILNQIAQSNAARETDIGKFNNQLEFQKAQYPLEVTNSMRSLYGTTPALAQTFGNQALGQQQLTEQQRQFDTGNNLRAGLGLISSMRGGGNYGINPNLRMG